MKKILKSLGIILGAFLIIYSIIVNCFVTLSLSYLLSGIIGMLIICYILLYTKIEKICEIHKVNFINILLKLVMTAFAVSFFFISLLIFVNSQGVPEKNADSLIILGAALRGEEVSKTLALRLDVAYEYLVENSESIAVVSGGQGDNEEIPEATAMKRYLVRKGIDADRIIEEDKSTRTVENFQFSKEILDGIFQEEYSVVYVTNGFHIFRSSLLAKQMGLNGSGLSADDVWYLELAHYIREYFSILKYFVIDR